MPGAAGRQGGRRFQTAASVPVSVVDQPAPQPAPVELGGQEAAPVAMSDFPTKEPRNIGQEESSAGEDLDFSLDGLLQVVVDPDLDLVRVSFDLPRHIVEGLRMVHVATRRPKRALVTDYIKAGLPAVIARAAYDKAKRGQLNG